MQDKIESPLFATISTITNTTAPLFTKGKFSTSELKDTEYVELQEWCVAHAKPYWSTGIGIMEAADIIVNEAVSNGNILGR